VSGMLGGYTGSYIFSQTIFCMRAGSTRLTGFIVAFFMFCVFVIPVSIMSYVPKFLFGAILTFIALELMIDWLFKAYRLV
jgi:SulP family sulfate permease